MESWAVGSHMLMSMEVSPFSHSSTSPHRAVATGGSAAGVGTAGVSAAVVGTVGVSAAGVGTAVCFSWPEKFGICSRNTPPLGIEYTRWRVLSNRDSLCF